MATAIDHAIAEGAGVINISQDTTKPLGEDSALGRAVARALAKDIVVVASAGNDGMDGTFKKTYPAAFPGVLAVASSDRNNERAAFSQAGEFVGVAAPCVDRPGIRAEVFSSSIRPNQNIGPGVQRIAPGTRAGRFGAADSLRLARIQGQDAVRAPITQQQLHHTRGVTHVVAAFAERQIVGGTQ